ncbi:MAG: septal ring lytic transglycosylase RlpA family protein [Hyphomonas sp.]|jgi:rare lipoprotein A|uniref:septal ring lytic transglycosylase RlpA family protein n=1 Tax=Hyphomonas sp. TaxID=87 RepID=UPI0032656308
MRAPSTKITDRLPALLAATLAAAYVTAPALADPAPIVFKTQGQSARISAERQNVFITPSQARPDAEKAKARVQFNYPGAPKPVQTAKSSNPVPQFANPAAEPREYASIRAPISAAPAPMATQTPATQAFDPRATAQRIATEREQAAVETESLPALAGAVQAKPEQGAAQPGATNLTPAATHSVTPETVPVFDETGAAIVYGDEFQGLPTANGEIFNQADLTAAHPNLPLPSLVQVVNIDTNTEVIVRVNDRGPFEDGAMLQVSQRAASELGMTGAGRANVRVRYLGPAPVAAPKSHPAVQVAKQDPPRAASISTVSAPAATYTSSRAGAQSYQPVSVGNYFVQVGAFSQISNAESLIQSMPGNLSAQIDPARVNGADFFRVRVGPFMSRDAADRMKDDLNRYGISNGRVVAQN